MPKCGCADVPRMTRRIKIEEPSISTDGESSATWSTLVTGVPAEIKYNRGNETRRGDQVVAIGTHTIKIMYRSDVTPQMRVVTLDTDETLNIVGASADDAFVRYLRIDCKQDQDA